MRAQHRFARISARKVRPIADLVRGKYADEALNILRYQPQRGARLIEQVIRSAVGNAQDPEQNKGQSVAIEALVVADVRVDGGPMFKRLRPQARGQAFIVKRRMSHITVGLVNVNDI
jgi:large subunit ribosomal protein L22